MKPPVEILNIMSVENINRIINWGYIAQDSNEDKELIKKLELILE